MNFRTTILLACAAIGVCAGYIAWRSRARRPAEVPAPAAAAPLLDLADDTPIAGIEYTPRDVPTMIFERQGNDWVQTAPVRCRATAWMVNELIIALKGAGVVTRQRVGAAEAPTLEAAGLAPVPRARIVLTTAANQRHEARIGAALLSSAATYAALPDDPDTIVIVDRDFEELLARAPVQYRDRQLFDFDPESADRVSLIARRAGTETRCALERRGAGWMITQPLEARADDTRVEAAIAAAARLWVDHWVEQASDQPLADYGLDPPALDIEIGYPRSGAPQAARLLVSGRGPLTDDRTVYVARAGESLVGTIGRQDIERFQPQMDRWRDLDLVPRALDDIGTLTLANAHGVLTLRRRDEAWFIDTTPERADDATLDALLSAVDGLVALSITDHDAPTPLQTVEATVTLTPVTGEPIVLRIGPLSNGVNGDTRTVQIDDRPQTATVSAADVAFALRPANAFYDPFVVHDTPQRLQRIAVRRTIGSSLQQFTLERNALHLWVLTPSTGEEVRQDAAQRLAVALAGLRGTRVIDPPAAWREPWPAPTASFTLTFEPPPVVGAGAADRPPTVLEVVVLQTADHILARLDHDERIYAIPQEVFDTLVSEVTPTP